MKRFQLVFLTILVVFLGVSCSKLPSTAVPTPFPANYIPTVIELTVQAGQTSLPTSTSSGPVAYLPPIFSPTPLGNSTQTPASTVLPANNSSPTVSSALLATNIVDLGTTPSSKLTLTPTPIVPVADVQIAMPGPMSRVISPLHLIANLRSIPSGSYHVELWIEPLAGGGDARLLYREVQNLVSNPIPWVYLDQEIEFELNRVSEYGQLRISVFDTYGRPAYINSVNLLLLSMGESEITPMGDSTQPIVINQPTPNQLIQGGTVIVSGFAKPTEPFMLVELVAADGSIVGYRQVFVTPAADGSYVPYSIEVPYQVATPTWVRLRISESGIRIPGMENLSSVGVLLSP